MKKAIRKTIMGLLVLVFIVSMLAGCGSSNTPTSAPTSTPNAATTAPTSTPTPTPEAQTATPTPEPEETPSPAPASSGNSATFDAEGAIVTLELPGEDWNTQISQKGDKIYVFKGSSYRSGVGAVVVSINAKSYGYGTNGPVTSLANRVIGGIDMEGRSYSMGQTTFVEYIAPISDAWKTCVQITLDPEDAEVIAILDSIQYTVK